MKRLHRFWTYQVRYRVARWLMHAGLVVWPEGPAKREVLAILGDWGRHVQATIAARRT